MDEKMICKIIKPFKDNNNFIPEIPCSIINK